MSIFRQVSRPIPPPCWGLPVPGMFDLSQLWERLFEDVTIEEEQRLQRNIVRGSRYLFLCGQIDQKGADFWSAHVRRMALVMEEDKPPGSLHIRLFRSD